MSTTSEYVEKLKNGDVPAFEHLYTKYSAKLYNFVLGVSGNDEYYAEEIVQSVFVKVWEMRSSLDNSGSFESYVFVIARNMLKNMYQHEIYVQLYAEEIRRSSGGINKDLIIDELHVRLLEKIIEEHIEELPPMRRKIFLLSRKSFLTYNQIAEKLDISVNTVENQMSRALSFLRCKLSECSQ